MGVQAVQGRLDRVSHSTHVNWLWDSWTVAAVETPLHVGPAQQHALSSCLNPLLHAHIPIS